MLEVPRQRMLVDGGADWSVAVDVPPHDPYLRHGPSGITLSVRRLRPLLGKAANDLEDEFQRYLTISWPGASWSSQTWREGELFGVTAIVEGAMPEAVVREWFVTDGRSLANASTLASSEVWADFLPVVENLVRSIKFHA